jgi:hypothetical protein
LRTEIGHGGGLPSAVQTDGALLTVLPFAIFNSSTVTAVTASTGDGAIMPDGPRTIKRSKTEIRDATGNVSVASPHIA